MTITIPTTVMLAMVMACGNGTSQGVDVDAPAAPSDGPAALSAGERATLAFVREEEKLARDVYDALDGNGQPFVNVQASEQRHMDQILVLLERYGLPDPAATTAIGAFVDPALQGLYTQLVGQGQAGASAAYTVGCTIEDLDLRDLDRAIAESTHADLDDTYALLAMGSRNHLRAFYGRLTAAGGSYAPQYIDQATFDAIVSSPHEKPAGGHRCGGGACPHQGHPNALRP
jgi:hypothetical protein